ncbi:PilZ domain-containing protein [Planctomyces sp. SH-PL14]|uniref:PilZ domain-containing protein n=1 Tax=Planctomyces sp. SH-PL14 TaxID=1632864 RepID=UPI00078E5F72|nr:PilZ domain-containing protein [Planctomyces sp. SH-PL14]AMV18372.1 PilZ domain protein [Planctomyces sp. SH-PL14]
MNDCLNPPTQSAPASSNGNTTAGQGMNRRRQARSSIVTPGWLLLLPSAGGSPELRRISTRDVSEGGARIVSMESIPSEHPWFVRFSTNGFDTKFIECKVCRVDEEVVTTLARKELRRYYYGVQFLRLFDIEQLSDNDLRDQVRALLKSASEPAANRA